MAPDSDRYNKTDYSLWMLKHEWGNYVEKQKQNKHSGGLMGQAYRLIKRDFDNELSDSVSESIKEVSKDWSFLNMFVRSIRKWSDADELMQKSGRRSTVRKINAVGHEIEREIRDCYYGKEYLKRPHKLLSLLGDCRRKTDELLKEEVGEALDYISTLKFHVFCPHHTFWGKFVDSVRRNLHSIIDADDCSFNKQFSVLGKELELIQRYIYHVQRSSLSSEFLEDHFIKTFLTHVASVVVRIANLSCNFWFSRADAETAAIKANKLVDLQHKIDPSNPEFIRLNLKFQDTLYKISSKTIGHGEEGAEFSGYFCSFLLNSCSKENLKKELMSLVNLFINSTLKDHSFREDVHNFFAEINAVLAEAAFLHHAVGQENETDDLCPSPELVTKICLLKTELFLKEQLNAINSSIALQNLKSFTEDLCLRGKTHEKQNLAVSEELATEIEFLFVSIRSKTITVSTVKHSLHTLLYKIIFFKAASFLADLIKMADTLIAQGKDQIVSLVEELNNLKPIVTNQLVTNSPNEEKIFIEFEAVARRITLFCYSFLPNNDKFKKMLLLLPQLLHKVKSIVEKLKEASSQFPVSDFPKTYQLGFLDFLSRNIKELLKYAPKSMEPVKHHLKEVQIHLESLKSFLIKVSGSHVEQEELNDLCSHIRDVAYKLEYIVESFEVDGHWQHSLWFYFLLEDIKLVSHQVSLIPEVSYSGKCKKLPKILCELVAKDTKSAINEMLVDLSDEQEAIIEQLTRGSLQRHVVSIVGMPGIGKTTLAKKVYSNQTVTHHFHRQAWCNVSQAYSKRELLLEILSGIHGLTREIRGMTNEDIEAKLRQCLLKNKYFIVMDDVWDIAAWNDLENSFPNDMNGSRILITSRLRDVATKIKPGSDPYSRRPFSDDESWMLLEKKIFKGERCPEELLLVGKEIARQCRGLPLAVVAIAGLLQRAEMRKDCWKKISKSLSSQIIKDPENRCMEVLQLSYKHLPDYLKACFLYLGVFLEDKDIPVKKLTWFWMAEGFIQETGSKSLEDVAEDCLMELINRSLVIISKTRSNGKVKACRLHDLLRDLCHLKAKEENFLHLVTRYDEPYASFPSSDYGMEFYNNHKLDPVTFKSYRLSIYLRRNHFIDSRPSGLGTRSLIFSASTDSEPRCPYDIAIICNNFKLLRVLDLECINLGVSFPVEIGVMVQLRYLAVSGYVNSIPPSLANLWKLETLIVKGFRGKVILPDTIWSLVRLRYLHVNNHVAFELQGKEQVGSSSCLDNLVSFSTPSLAFGEDTINVLRRFPNLLKLRCIFLESWDSFNNRNRFPVLSFLTRLESLKIIYYGGALNPGKLILPRNLKKLTLSNFRLPWKHISRIGKLPNLRVLKLLAGAFEGQRWDMMEEEFKQLQFLKLDALDIVEWNASSDHLPKLEQLKLRNCKDLKGIPDDFACINTLQMIEVQWCSQSVEESAREIGDVTGEIEVLITHS